jgi:ATP-dependent RNA helicase SUPV3L1/SUV3
VSNTLPPIPDFNAIRNILEVEHKSLVKVGSIREDESNVRSIEDAITIVNGLEKIDLELLQTFQQYPTLVEIFEKDFGGLNEFFHRDVVLELAMVDDCFFPEKELFVFVDLETKHFRKDFFDEHINTLSQWCKDRISDHTQTQKQLDELVDLELKSKDLKCQCITCIADYRNKLREGIFAECITMIESTKTTMENCLESATADQLVDHYRKVQKDLDKKLYNVRFKLKRSTVNRLESQIKEKIRTTFNFPSILANKRIEQLKPFFIKYLRAQALRPDLVGDSEYHRWFKQLSTNIWRSESYLEAEFAKLVKSVLALKRKDISANILKEYLGEFWIHSPARRITRTIVYHMGPTNSGKTYHAIQNLAKVKTGCYLAPLRLLAAELYDTLNELGAKTTLLTGEEVIEVEGATHFSSTIEMAKLRDNFDCAVIDEIQMISDPQRGWAWTRALVNISAPEVHICGDNSVLDLIKQIVELCGDQLVIKQYERMTELKVATMPLRLADMERSDALIVFSRKNALKCKADLEQLGFKISIVYGRLSPEVRREQARKFDKQETDIIVATDAIAMGMNLPIKRIVFSTLTKHIDNEAIAITHSEIKQISGRAGRYLRFPVGEVTCLTKVEDGLSKISEAIFTDLNQKDQCMVGPDLEIFNQVNHALKINALPELKLSEFLRLFNTMTFQKPFYCVDMKEMIELAEMVEEADFAHTMSNSEIFGFACAPVNLGLLEHVQYYVWLLNQFVKGADIIAAEIDYESKDIDYLETSIKCIELYQWLARHFNNKYFVFTEWDLLENKAKAIEQLNNLLSEKTIRSCASCGIPLDASVQFAICDECFRKRRFRGGPPPRSHGQSSSNHRSGPRQGQGQGQGQKSENSNSMPFKVDRPPRRGKRGGFRGRR